MINNKKMILLITSLVTFSGMLVVYHEYTKNIVSTINLQESPSQQYKIQPLANESSTTTDSELTDAGNWVSNLPIDESGVLGIAANFNIFANHISSSSYQQLTGNFATKSLLSDSSIIGKKDTLSYIQSEVKAIPWGVINNNSGKLILGQQFHYNKNSTMLTDGSNTVKIVDSGLYRENSNQIDFDNEFIRLKENSKKIADFAQNNNPVITDSGVWGKQNVNLSNLKPIDGILYINFKSLSDLQTFYNSTSSNMPSDVKTIVINMDVATDIKLDLGTQNQALAGKKVMLNFYNTSQNQQFDKSINLGNQSVNLGLIFAPAATVNVSHGYAGSVVANEVTNSNSNALTPFPDIDVPTDDNTPKSSLIVPKNIDFGKVSINSVNTITKEWSPEEQKQLVVGGPKDSNLKINLSVSNQKINGNTLSEQQALTWNLIYTDPKTPTNNHTQAINQGAGIINYWRWNGNQDSAWYPLKDWTWNKANQTNPYYEFQITNLKNIQQVGQYTADLTWTINDAP
ncbi:hypothetical protein GCM10025879_17850 [Leuconostoc litchii]|uniref:Choice-of-anchor A domain-containing protein n=1 Tax=Leuconostoc litchii TaxID=1981069 RepID=A0A6P2CL08_9LACO|nr:collagen-binding domain-containing protein [Leuconostoc litchii]TYC46670.1 hypothetical protein ESZ47_00600 [Leuconostoc litchii]GMA70539.1 hypothetical protein GCM10025879_17850 [Leuconostoc litchii]